jgi:hypothetical protein
MPDYTPTFAELCSAIADGGVIATLDGSMYEVNAFELRRYFSKIRALPGITPLSEESPQKGENGRDLQNSHHVQKH